MTHVEFGRALCTLGWGLRHVVRALRCDTNLPTYWARGEQPIPQPVAAWLSKLETFHQRNPAPEQWRG